MNTNNEYIILMTASLKRDFEFFSKEVWPSSVEELKSYREKLGKSDFSVIVKIEDGRFWAYIEKIPSEKQDHQGRPMYYIVTAQGNIGNNPIAETIFKIAVAAVEDMKGLGKKFDQTFTSEYISSFDNCRHTLDTESEIRDKIIMIAEQLSDFTTNNYTLEQGLFSIGNISADKNKFISALNIIKTHNQFEGITLLSASDKSISQTTIDYIQKDIAATQGLIMSTDNKVSTNLLKKKIKPMTSTQDSSTNSSNGSKQSKKGIISTLFGISLILNFVMVIWLMHSQNSVKSIATDMSKKDSLLHLAKLEMVSLANLKTPKYNGTTTLDVASFVETGDVNIKDSANYDYTFKVFSADSIGIYSKGSEVFRGNPKLMKDNDLKKILAEFSEKIKPYISSTEQQTNNKKDKKQNR